MSNPIEPFRAVDLLTNREFDVLVAAATHREGGWGRPEVDDAELKVLVQWAVNTRIRQQLLDSVIAGNFQISSPYLDSVEFQDKATGDDVETAIDVTFAAPDDSWEIWFMTDPNAGTESESGQ